MKTLKVVNLFRKLKKINIKHEMRRDKLFIFQQSIKTILILKKKTVKVLAHYIHSSQITEGWHGSLA